MIKKNSIKVMTGPLEASLLLCLFLFFLTIKFFFLFYAQPLPDEAYYWLWSQNIALSYFDHPPLSIWLQSFLSSFSNEKYFLIRTPPTFSLGIVLIILISWQQYTLMRFDYLLCMKSVLLFLAFPIYTIFFSISFPDYLLITLLFASAFCFFLYFDRKDNKMHNWYLAVFLFSFALLTKYNAILFGAGVLAYILFNKNKIKTPSYGHIIASIVIIFSVQLPVLLWNLTNDFASFSFHLSERLDQRKDFLHSINNIFAFLSGVFLAFSPIFILNLKNNFYRDLYSENWKKFFSLSRFVFIFSLIFCMLFCFFTNILYYWFTPAVILLVPFLINVLGSKMAQYFHIFYGIVISLFLLINISIYPISLLFGDVDRETAILFGWDKITKIVDEEKKLHGTEKIVFSDYRMGSLYIFHSGDFEADVVMENRLTQFDVWRDKEKPYANKTLIITDDDFPIGQKILSKFDTIEFIKDIGIYIGDKLVRKYKVYLGISHS